MELINKQYALASAISGIVITDENGEKWIRTRDVRESIINVPTIEVEPIKMMCNGDHINCPAHKDYERGFKDGQAEAQMTAEPVKHGRWLIYNILDYAKRPTGRKVAKCSICGQLTPDFRLITEEPNWNYCPNCGAIMDEVEE